MGASELQLTGGPHRYVAMDNHTSRHLSFAYVIHCFPRARSFYGRHPFGDRIEVIINSRALSDTFDVSKGRSSNSKCAQRKSNGDGRTHVESDLGIKTYEKGTI